MKIKHILVFVFLLGIYYPVIAKEKTTLQETEPTIIETIQDGESFSIEITSIGCFNGTRQTVVVSREADIYTAQFQDQIKVLSENDFNAFKRFEVQLRNLNMGGCTTVDTYVLNFGNQRWQTSDGTCSWNGGRKLLKVFA